MANKMRAGRILSLFLLILLASCVKVPGQSASLPVAASPIVSPSAGTRPPAAGNPTEEQPLPLPTTTPGATSTPREDTPSPVLTPLGAQLTSQGPWLLAATSSGLWAANADGSGLTRLLKSPIIAPQNIMMAAQPGGNLLAFISADPDGLHNLKLNLLSLPTGGVKTLTPLTNKNTEPGPSAEPAGDKIMAIRAITNESALAWSPDGKTLAFIGAQDGPSADLYTYSTENGRITRLVDGPSQAYHPVWSPDGRYILHFGATNFGTGADSVMAGGWAVHASDGQVITLFTGGGSGQEFRGWVDDHRFLLSGWTPSCGNQDLRIVDLQTQSQVALVTGCFSSVAAAANTGLVLVAGGFSWSPGLYRLDPGSKDLTRISDEDITTVRYLHDSADFLAESINSQIIFGNNGDLLVRAPATGCEYRPDVAGFGLIYAWSCSKGDEPGLWINGPGIPSRKIFSGPVAAASWSPGNTLLFFSGTRLYRAFFFEYQPEEAGGSVHGDVIALGWAGRKD